MPAREVTIINKLGLHARAAAKFVAVGFGIKKLQINLVVEDDKISIDELQAEIEEDEDHVQSTDVVSLNLSPLGAVDADLSHQAAMQKL